jgi:ribonuclease P protein component
VKRRFRLNKSTDFKRVRRFGKSYAHPLIVLIAIRNEAARPSHIGVAAGRAVGNAVHRNRAKRLLRAAIAPHLADLHPGWDLVLLARGGMVGSSYQDIHTALLALLNRAHLLQRTDDDQQH